MQTDIPDVVIIEPSVFTDERGWFMESFNEQRFHNELEKLGLSKPRPFVQDNHSCSRKGVLRGLHYQLDPRAQGKLVRVMKGAAYDVAVDIRKSSPTYGKWVGVELSEKNKKMLWIPEGFAHGFIALEDDTNFLYKTTNYYCSETERAIKWDDPDIAIEWPSNIEFKVSEKDNFAPRLCDTEVNFEYSNSAKLKLIDFGVVGDFRGSLVSIEQKIDIPFEIKRAYYIYDTQSNVERGFHAHRQLQQLAICVSGSCRMVIDDGESKENIWLSSPDKGLLIGDMVWREMHDFSADCVLLVLASEHYDESDYIRNYDQFKKEVDHGKN